MTEDVQVLCEIESDLSSADESKFKKKNRHFWNRGAPYSRVNYQVKVLIGPADITFELWFDNQKLSKDQPIKVEFVAAASAPNPAVSAAEEPIFVKDGATTLVAQTASRRLS
ncbi:hypothetical protein B0A49_00619 [Cryomyces minteri]|uniref:Uncharacterized protein n=1 Tax=Cryomyces minteri TaxID=331657 RepID=A0A4U0XV27_9PEZI|nr:hypothetical protein B0A49_00619 [Cryomyces minteri]